MNFFLPISFVRQSLYFLAFVLVLSVLAPQVLAHESTNNRQLIIHVDEKGFSPKTVSVTVGTEVIFENVGKEEHWPASDNHPSHTLYDGTPLEEHCQAPYSSSFDSCASIVPGQSWSYIFEKEGIFGYHDHLWPHLEGEITVTTLAEVKTGSKGLLIRMFNWPRRFFVFVSSFFQNPEETNRLTTGNTETDFYVSLKQRYEQQVVDSDPRQAIAMLEEESRHNARVSALCHDVLHIIGQTAYQKYGGVKAAIPFQTDFCNSGYIHGVFTSYFQSTADPLGGLASYYGPEAFQGWREFDIWQYHHGIGHALMYFTGGDLDKSLDMCAQEFDPRAAASCQNGVYMEVFNLEILAKEESFIDKNNPFLTCRTRVAKDNCYLIVPTYLSLRGMDFADIFKECDKAEPGYVTSCIHGVGAEAIKRNMNDPAAVFALCQGAGPSRYQLTCAQGVTGMYMQQEGSYAAGQRLCTTAPPEYQDACAAAVSSRESFFKEPA